MTEPDDSYAKCPSTIGLGHWWLNKAELGLMMDWLYANDQYAVIDQDTDALDLVATLSQVVTLTEHNSLLETENEALRQGGGNVDKEPQI